MNRIFTLYEQQKGLSQFCADMHELGIQVDRNYQAKLDHDLTRKALEAKGRLEAIAPEIRFTKKEASKDSLRTLIYSECAKPGIRNFGIQCPVKGTNAARIWRSGKTQKPSVGRDAVNNIRQTATTELKAILDAWKAFAEPLKLRGSFTRGKKLASSIWPDGACHPDWNSGASRFSKNGQAKDDLTGGAVTGRFTCWLQTIPKEDPKRGFPNLRGIFIPRPGYVFMEFDYQAAEGWAIAAITKDPVWKELLKSGDIHTSSAIKWFGLPPETTKATCPPRIRTLAKNGRYACCYEAQAQKVHTQLIQGTPEVTLAEAAVIVRKMREMHPVHVAWRTAEQERVTLCGYSEDRIMGRRRYYVERPKPTETSNYPIQATVASIINCAVTGVTPDHIGTHVGILDLLSTGVRGGPYDARIVAQVHDSLLIEVREDQIDLIKWMIVEAMEGPWKIEGQEWRFPVDVTIFRSRWGEK